MNREPIHYLPEDLVLSRRDLHQATSPCIDPFADFGSKRHCARSCAHRQARAHGFSEILYACTSAAATNGSSFAGLSANTPFYNLTLGLAMFLGRFLVTIPVLAIVGSLAAKPIAPSSAGTLPTTGVLFVALLTGVIVIVGGLTFLPALTLGPLAEYFAMEAGLLF
jgi:K+-transporting ATPase ATPase A chain